MYDSSRKTHLSPVNRERGLARSDPRPSARTHPVAVGTTSQYFRRLIYIVSIEAFEVPNHSLIFLSNLRHFIEIREKLERIGDNLGAVG